MELEKEILELPITKILIGFCPNPTPFKPIAQLPDSCSVSDVVDTFSKSDKKRKVVAIMTEQGEWQLGENELQIYINRYKNHINPPS